MDITLESPEWTTENIDILRQFLQSPTGRRLLPKVLENAPVLLPSGDINAILIRSGEFRGFASAIQTLLFLTAEPLKAPESTANNYPPLEKDAEWNDGNTLTPNE